MVSFFTLFDFILYCCRRKNQNKAQSSEKLSEIINTEHKTCVETNMKRWKTIKNCLWNNNRINGTMGYVWLDAQRRSHLWIWKEKKKRFCIQKYSMFKRKWRTMQYKPYIRFKFRLRVEKYDRFHFFISLLEYLWCILSLLSMAKKWWRKYTQ